MAKLQNRSTKNDPVLKALPLACADEDAAIVFMEVQRWGEHPACPHCGSTNVYQMRDSKTGERQANYRWRCREKHPSQQFTVRTGTVFEDSRVELRHWCFAFWRASTSKKGVSALELHRQTGLSYKTCLFMLHRIRFAMSDSVHGPLSGDVEVDETYVDGKSRFKGTRKRGRGTKKQCVLAMVERGGNVRTKPIANITAKMLKAARSAITSQRPPRSTRTRTAPIRASGTSTMVGTIRRATASANTLAAKSVATPSKASSPS